MSTTRGTGRPAQAEAGKYLTFFLGHVSYGLQILRVRELIGLQEITELPQAPTYVKGVINLRDTVIPIVDLRGRFGMPEIEATEQTCIVVVQVESRTIGLLVDRVSEVQDIGAQAIEGPPAIDEGNREGFILGISKAGGRVTLLLDVDRIVGGAAQASLAEDLLDATV
ncbi:MAG: chemotaxis protein CheW [Candidatus Krumholzibacteriia bacterium]